jgi:hypothetical protein
MIEDHGGDGPDYIKTSDERRPWDLEHALFSAQPHSMGVVLQD